MFAVIKTGGKQYRVQTGDVIEVEKLNVEKGQKLTFDHILLIDDDERTLIGTPWLENAQVRAEVLENFKGEKVIIFKKKRRKQYRRKLGHRQELTRVRIEEIISELKAAAKRVEEKPEAAEEPKKVEAEKEVKLKVAKEKKQKKPEKAKLAKKEAKAPAKPRAARAKTTEKKAPAKGKAGAGTASKVKKSK